MSRMNGLVWGLGFGFGVRKPLRLGNSSARACTHETWWQFSNRRGRRKSLYRSIRGGQWRRWGGWGGCAGRRCWHITKQVCTPPLPLSLVVTCYVDKPTLGCLILFRLISVFLGHPNDSDVDGDSRDLAYSTVQHTARVVLCLQCGDFSSWYHVSFFTFTYRSAERSLQYLHRLLTQLWVLMPAPPQSWLRPDGVFLVTGSNSGVSISIGVFRRS